VTEPVVVPDVECPVCGDPGPHAEVAASEELERLLCAACETVFDIQVWPGVGAVSGAPLNLPPGQHPFDWYLAALTNLIGERKAAAYLGIASDDRNVPR